MCLSGAVPAAAPVSVPAAAPAAAAGLLLRAQAVRRVRPKPERPETMRGIQRGPQTVQVC